MERIDIMSLNSNKKKTSSDAASRLKKNIFETNAKYFTICIYAFFLIVVSTVFIYCVANWSKTQATISNIISILSPFFVGFFIAYVLNPIVKKLDHLLEKKIFRDKLSTSVRHGISILSAYILALGIIIVISTYVVPQFITSVQDLSENVPAMYNAAYNYLNNLQVRFPDIDIAFIEDKINEIKPNLISLGTNLVTSAFPVIFDISVSIVKSIVNVLLSIVISAYIIIDKKTLMTNLKRLVYSILPKDTANYLCTTTVKCNSIFSGFIFGKLVDSLIIGIICFVVMSIIRLPYAVLLSTIVGITNMIPYFGPFIGAVPGIVIYLLLDPVQAIIFAVMILILQQFDGLYLGPKILGESTGLKPIWVIFAITVGGAYFGVLGMFLGVPVVAVVAYLLNDFIQRRLKKRNITNI